MQAKINNAINKLVVKITAMIIIIMFSGVVYSLVVKNDIKTVNIFPQLKKGDVLELRDSSKNNFDWIIIHSNDSAKQSLNGEFLIKRRMIDAVEVPLLTYEDLNDFIRQNKLSVKISSDSSDLMREIINLKLK